MQWIGFKFTLLYLCDSWKIQNFELAQELIPDSKIVDLNRRDANKITVVSNIFLKASALT